MTAVLIGVIAVLVVTAAAELLSERTRIAAPILLLAIGAAVARIPNMPEFEIDPELVLMVILPPLLYSAAVNMPINEFRRNLMPIGTLAIVLVAVSAAVIGFVGRVMIWMRSKIHEVTPDTVLSLATPFVAFLPAEHLHASGLVAAVVAGLVASSRGPRVLTPTQRMSSKTTWNSLMMILESSVFLLMGLELTAVVDDLHGDSYGWQLAAGIAALALVLSLVLRTIVVFPLLRWLARRSERRSQYRPQLEKATQRVDAALDSPDGAPANPGWVAEFRQRMTRMISDLDYHSDHALGPREGAVMIWAGMRGAITLAAAQTLPLATPHRSFLIFVAFLVAAGSLLIQGTTLNLAVKLIRPREAGEVNPEEHEELRAILRGAVRTATPPRPIQDLLAKMDPDADSEELRKAAVTLARQQFEAMRAHSADDAGPGGPQSPLSKISPEERRAVVQTSYDYALALISAQRDALLDANDIGVFSSEAIGGALDRLDADQLSLETRAVSLN